MTPTNQSPKAPQTKPKGPPKPKPQTPKIQPPFTHTRLLISPHTAPGGKTEAGRFHPPPSPEAKQADKAGSSSPSELSFSKP